MIKRTALLLVSLVALLGAAPVAQADDRSVYKAWKAENKSWATLEDRLEGNLKTWQSSGYRKTGPALETIGKIRALIARRKKAVAAEAHSTGEGKDAKSLALANLRTYDSAMVKLKRAVELGAQRKYSEANENLREYRALLKRASSYERRAQAAFEDADVAR